MRFKPPNYAAIQIFLSRRKAAVVLRKGYVSIAVNAVPSRSSRYICGFLLFSAVEEGKDKKVKAKDLYSGTRAGIYTAYML